MPNAEWRRRDLFESSALPMWIHDIATGRLLDVNENTAVHFLVFHLDPIAGQTHLGAVAGGAVKPLGESTFHVGGNQVAILYGFPSGPMVMNVVSGSLSPTLIVIVVILSHEGIWNSAAELMRLPAASQARRATAPSRWPRWRRPS